MADSVKIKIDGDDSDFKSKMSELGKNAAKALGNAGSAIATSLGAGLAAAGAGFPCRCPPRGNCYPEKM